MSIKDFQSNQVRTTKIIGSGSVGGEPSIIIYSSSNASDFIGSVGDSSMLSDVGTDVFLFVSGTKSSLVGLGKARSNVSLFGGDVIVSGTLFAERMITEVDESVTGSLLVSGSLFVSQSARIGDDLWVADNFYVSGSSTIDGSAAIGNDLWVSDNAYVSGSVNVAEYIYHGGDLDTYIRFQADDINIQAGGVDFIKITEDLTQDTIIFNDGGADVDFRVESDNGTHAIFVDAGSDVVHINQNEAAVTTQIHNDNDVAITVSATEVVINDDSHASIDFRVESDGEDEAIFLDSSANTLEINKGETAFLTTIHNVDGEAISVTATEVVINDDGEATVDFRVESDDEGQALFIDASANKLYINKGNSAFTTTIENVNAQAIDVTADGVTFNEEANAVNDFRVESSAHQGAILLDAGTEQLGLLTDGKQAVEAYGLNAATDPIPADTNVFVSGAIGSKDSAVKGTALFGGDLVASGSLYINTGISSSYIETGELRTPTGDLLIDVSGDIILDADGGNVIFKDGTQQALNLDMGSSGGDVGDAIFKDAGNTEIFRIDSSEDSLRMASSNQIQFTDANEAIWGDSTNLHLKATNAITIMSGGVGTDMDPVNGTDINLFVSGAIGSRNSAVRGTALFGGDTVVSGALDVQNNTLTIHNSSDLDDKFTVTVGASGATTLASIDADAASAHFTVDAAGTIYLDAYNYGWVVLREGAQEYLRFEHGTSAAENDHAIIQNMENGKDLIFQQYDGNETLRLTDGMQVLVLSGGATADPDPAAGTDVNFFVSGAIGSKGGAAKGTSLFGGDLVVSGSATIDGSATVGNDLWVADNAYVSGSATMAGPFSAAGSVTVGNDLWVADNAYVSGSATVAGSTTVGNDLWVLDNSYVSGGLVVLEQVGIGTTSPRTELQVGTGAAQATIQVFAGGSGGSGSLEFRTTGGSHAALVLGADGSFNVVNSGSNEDIVFKGNDGGSLFTAMTIDMSEAGRVGIGTTSPAHALSVVGVVSASLGLSGSLTRLVDGTSYLVAGDNVTVTSASNGQVTIASTAGGTVDGSGAATRLAYWSDADTLTSDADLIFDGDTLTAANSSNTAISAIKIDRNYTGTTSIGNFTTDPQGLLIDYDVTGIVASGQTSIHDALAINYNQDSPTMVGTINATGADIRMTGGTSGVQSMKGVAITLAGADTNIGIDITAPNDSTHFIARSSDSLLDNFQISVGSSGATTLSTSDAGAEVGNLTLDADGKIVIEAVAGDEVVFNEGSVDVDFRVESSTKQGALLLDGGAEQVGLLTDGTSAADAYGLNASTDPIPADTNLFVSGAIGSRDSAVKGTALFGGDTVISGSLLVGGRNFHAQAGAYVGGTISGSIHQTSGGLSYLMAGSNVTITSASNGQVTIASSGGGGGTPGGSDTQVQYNNGGSFGGVADLTFNDSTGDVTVGTSTGDAKLFFRDAGNYIYSNADGDFDIINTDGSAANSILIDCNAGGVTIDGHTGVDIDASNSGKVSIDGAGGIDIGVAADVAIDIDSAALDIDASGAITIDGSSTMVIDSNDDSSWTVSASGKDLTLGVSGGSTQVLKLDSAGTGTDAIDVNATAGGVDIDAAGAISLDSSAGSIDINVVDGQTVSVGLNGAVETVWTPHGTAGSEKWSTTNTSGNATDAIAITATAGGVDVGAGTVLALDGTTGINIGVAADAPIDIDSTTLDIDASGAITIDGTSTFSVDAVGTSNVTTNGALTVSGSTALNLHSHGGEVDITSTQGNIDINAAAGAIDIDAGAGGIALDSPGGVISLNADGSPPSLADINFFVSGAIGSRGSAVKGTTLFGGDVVVSGSLCVGSGSLPSTAKTAFSFVNDFNDVTFENQLNDGDGGGNIIKYGGGSLVKGALHYLSGSGDWQRTDSGAEHTGSSNLLAVAMGTSPTVSGLLLEGFVKLDSNRLKNNPASDDIGKPVYVASGSTGGTGHGQFTLTAPSGSGEVVRVVGHCVDIDSNDILLYFKPDSTSIVLS